MKLNTFHTLLSLGIAVCGAHCFAGCSGELDDEVAMLSSAVPVASTARPPNSYPNAAVAAAGGTGGAPVAPAAGGAAGAPAEGGAPATGGAPAAGGASGGESAGGTAGMGVQ